MEIEKQFTEEERKKLVEIGLERFEMLYDKVKSNSQTNNEPFETMILSVNTELQGNAIHSFLDRQAKATLIWWEAFYCVFTEMCKRTTGYSIEEIILLNADNETDQSDPMELMNNSNINE